MQNITAEYTNGKHLTRHKCGYVAVISIRAEVDKDVRLEINDEAPSTTTQPTLLELIALIIFANSRVNKVRDYEIFALLGSHAVIPYRRFGTIYRPIFNGQIVQERYVFP